MLKMLLAAVVAALLAAPPAFAGDARLVPPDMSIDPLTMSDAELQAHPEIPPKPNAKDDPRGHELWVKSMGDYRKGVREGVVEVIKDLRGNAAKTQYGPTYSSDPDFAGAIAPSLTGTTTSSTSLSFTVPTYSARACPSNESLSHWAGMQSSGGLWQAGLIAYITFNGTCQTTAGSLTPFWEAVPGNLPQTFPGVAVHTGDTVYAQVWNTASNTGYAKFWNQPTGIWATVTYTTSFSLANPGFEWLTEAASTPPYMGHRTFYGSASDQYGHIYAPGVYNYSNVNYMDMIKSGITIMHIGSIGNQYYILND